MTTEGCSSRGVMYLFMQAASSFEADADGSEVAMRGGTHDLSVLGMTLLSFQKALTHKPKSSRNPKPPQIETQVL